MLAAVVRPSLQEVDEVHKTIVKKIWKDVILPCGATLITLGLLLLLGWAIKLKKLYAMKKYVERFRSSDEETAAAAALQMRNIDVEQEKKTVRERECKDVCSPENLPGRNELQRAAPEKIVSKLLR